MAAHRCRAARRSFRIIGWTVLFYVAGQAALSWYISRVDPRLRDWEYGRVILGLKARLAESPRRPLVVILGSSRSAGALRPSCLPPPPPGTPEAVVFNCSMVASGPIRELQMFRRLLRDGIRPDYLFIESWSPYLVQRQDWYEENLIRMRTLDLVDWRILLFCRERRLQFWRQWLETQLAPASAFRQSLLTEVMPALVPPPPPRQSEWTDPARRHGEDGWVDPPDHVPDPRWAHLGPLAWKGKMRIICDPFTVHPPADRAFRELLALAREEGITTFLLLCPDHSCARGPAGMDTWDANAAYLNELAQTYTAPVIDTRDWVADKEIPDYVHVTRKAAVPYTQRFGREILYPLLAGEPLSSQVVLPASSSPSPSAALAPQ